MFMSVVRQAWSAFVLDALERDTLIEQRRVLEQTVENLRKELDINMAFYKLTVSQRDRAWEECGRLRAESAAKIRMPCAYVDPDGDRAREGGFNEALDVVYKLNEGATFSVLTDFAKLTYEQRLAWYIGLKKLEIPPIRIDPNLVCWINPIDHEQSR